VFTTSRHDPVIVEKTLRLLAGPDAEICGGYGVGIITNDYLGYDGFQVGLLLIKDSGIKTEIFWGQGIDTEPEELGERVGAQIKNFAFDTKPAILLLYDSANHTNGSYRMNMAEPFLKTLKGHLNSRMSAGARASWGYDWRTDVSVGRR
jgi:hypothetical protein